MFKKEKNSNLISKTTLRKIKKQVKGITLIALVVTIIVLLILAGIALNLTIGENGLFTRAQNSSNTWQLSEQNEQNAMNSLASWIDEYLNENSENFQENPEGKEETLLAMFNQAIKDKCTNEDDTCNNPNHLHIGDYVSISNPTSGSAVAYSSETGYSLEQTYTINETKNQLKWRVLGIDNETGGIKLIADTTLVSDNQDGFLHLYGAQGYVTGYLTPDTICKQLYSNLNSNYVKKVRSVSIEDINTLLGVTDELFKALNDGTQGPQYGDSYELNGYTPESYLRNEQVNTTMTENSYYYYVTYPILGEIKPYPMTNERIYNMIFGDYINEEEMSIVEENIMTYYLPTRANGCTTELIRTSYNFGVGGVGIQGEAGLISNCLCYNSNTEYGYLMHSEKGSTEINIFEEISSIRPVLCLESNVTNKQIPKV